MEPSAQSNQQEESSLEQQRQDRAVEEAQYIQQRLKESGKDSAQNSDAEEDEKTKDAKQDEKDKKDFEVIKYSDLGGSECPVSPDDEVIEYCMVYRIPRIEGLQNCTKLQVGNPQHSHFHISTFISP